MSCQNEDKTQPRVMDLQWQKPDQQIWTVSAKRMSPHKKRDLWSILGMTTTEKRVGLASGNWGTSGSNFTENLEDTEVPAPAHISHDSDSERPTEVTSRKHCIFTHFPKDPNCEVCLRTKLTRAPCRRRTDEAVHRAEKFGDLITADHKVLNVEGEFRNNHRYAVVLQDLATQWIQSIRVKQKFLRRRQRV